MRLSVSHLLQTPIRVPFARPRTVCHAMLGALCAVALLSCSPSTAAARQFAPDDDDAVADLAPAPATAAKPPSRKLNMTERACLGSHMLMVQLRPAIEASALATRPRGRNLIEVRRLLCDGLFFALTDSQKQRLSNACKSLVATDPDDPFVRMADLVISARAYTAFTGKLRPADRDNFPRLLDQYRAGNYPMPFAAVVAFTFALDAQKSALADAEKAAWMRRAGDVLIETAMSVKDNAPLESLLVQLTENTSRDSVRLDEECIDRLMKSDASLWLRNTVAGSWHFHNAFRIRGTAYADKVPEQAWAGFRREIGAAAHCLKLAYTADPSRPEPAARMVSVSGAGGDDDVPMLTWLDRVFAVYPDHYDAATSALHYLRPRWGGSYEEMIQLGERCLNTRLFDTSLPGIYLEALEYIYEDAHRFSDVRAVPNLVANLKKLAEGYLAHPSNFADINLSKVVALYWKLGRCGEAYDLMRTIEGPLHTRSFSRSGLSTFRLDSYEFDAINAYDQPSRALAEAADAAIARGDFAAANASLAQALALPRVYIDQRRSLELKAAITRFAGEFASGGWAHVNAQQDCEYTLSFHRASKFYAPLAPASVQHKGPDGEAVLIPSVGQRYEVSTRIIFDKSIGSKCTFAFLPYANTEVFNRRASQLVEFRPASNTVLLGDDTRKGREIPVDLSAKPLDVTLKCWNGDVVLIVNDQVVFADAMPEADIRETSDRFGLAVRGQEFKTSTPIVFENLQLRRLTEPPPELNRGIEARPEPLKKPRPQGKPSNPRS